VTSQDAPARHHRRRTVVDPPALTDAPAAGFWRRASILTSQHSRATEAVIVILVLAALQVVVYHGYYSGANSPQWDFIMHANAHAWWETGSFVKPTEWTVNLWGGYSAAADLQNSSWYLPVGLVAAVTNYDLHGAAILIALHTAFGALGVYLLLRMFKVRPSAAIVGMTAWHFVGGFFSHASQIDLAHGYAWLPWVLMCAAPQFPWRRWWAPIVATIIFWQTALGVYPGMLIAGAYMLVIWIAVHQILSRPRLREYLAPLLASGVLAVLLTSLRFLPALLVRGAHSPTNGSSDVWDWSLLGTFIYPYSDNRIPNDITMKSFFIPVVILAAATLFRCKSPTSKATAAMTVTAFAFSLPDAPWTHLVSKLPGMGISRFHMSDFTVFTLLGLVVMAGLGLQRLIEQRRVPQWVHDAPSTISAMHPQFGRLDTLVLFLLVLAAAAVGKLGPFATLEWFGQWFLLVIAAALLLLARTTISAVQLRSIIGMLVIVCGFSGISSAFATTATWSVSREATEWAYLGNSVSNLIASAPQGEPETQRPARFETLNSASGFANAWFTNYGLRAFFDGTIGFSGYVNLKGDPTFETILASLSNPTTYDRARAFWLSPGIVVATADGEVPEVATTEQCAATGSCDGLSMTPVSFSPEPVYVYRVSAPTAVVASLNEAYYPGWSAQVCEGGALDHCLTAPVRGGVDGQVLVDIPAGDGLLTLRYHQPGLVLAWWMFTVGCALIVAWSGILALQRHRRRRQPAADALDGPHASASPPRLPFSALGRRAQLPRREPRSVESDDAPKSSPTPKHRGRSHSPYPGSPA